MSNEPQRNGYRAAIEAAKQETAEGLDETRLRRARARLLERLSQPSVGPAIPWRFVMVTASVAACIAAVVILVGRPFVPVDGEREQLATELPRVLLESGGIELEGHDGGTLARLPRGARIDAVVGKIARVTVRGPARARITRKGEINLESGLAMFSVRPRPANAPFSIRAGDARVTVLGTRFAVAVGEGRLTYAGVVEGRVEIRRNDGKGGEKLLGPGETVGQTLDAVTDDLMEDAFDAPWWPTPEPALAATGELQIHSVPDGAEVTIDGVSAGMTPLSTRLPVGETDVVVEMVDHESFRQSVSIKERRQHLLEVELKRRAKAEESPSLSIRAPDYWARATRLLKRKRCTQLDEMMGRLLKQSPADRDKGRAETLQAECRLRVGEKRRALRLYRRVARRFSHTPSGETALFEVAKITSELTQGGAAIKLFESYLAKYPQGQFAADATFRRCELLVSDRLLEKARACLEQYSKSFPKALHTADSVLLQATLARIESRWSRAVELYTQYLEMEPASRRRESAAYHRIVCLQLGNLPGLQEAVSAFLAQYPDGVHVDEVRKLVKPNP